MKGGAASSSGTLTECVVAQGLGILPPSAVHAVRLLLSMQGSPSREWFVCPSHHTSVGPVAADVAQAARRAAGTHSRHLD